MEKKIELLCPAGSMANLKAAVSRGADAAYLGMQKFNAREFATNFNEKYLKEAVNIYRSNSVKLYLTMNTLVKNNEIKDFFEQLSIAYSAGIDAVIIQEISFLDIIKKNFPGLKVHISTQAGIMNSDHANMLSNADRINLARELTKDEIKKIRNNFKKELEIFCHGALCVSVSGSCLFSSFLGGRSGNRGRCAQPCRRMYDNKYLISTKDLCLIDEIPKIIELGIDSIKVEGRMRTPYYAASVTDAYRKAIDRYYAGDFYTADLKKQLSKAFNRGFTRGIFNCSKDIFNNKDSCGKEEQHEKEIYSAESKEININRKMIDVKIPSFAMKDSSEKRLLVRVYSAKDAAIASEAGADIVYIDLFDKDFISVKEKIKSKLFGVTPRIMLDSDIDLIKKLIKEKKPEGVFAGNLGVAGFGLDIPIHLDYNQNLFNDIDLDYFGNKGAFAIISPELSIRDLKGFNNKDFGVLVHGKIKLMTLRHDIKEGTVKDEKNESFWVNKIKNGVEILNGKELGMFNKSSEIIKNGINNFFIDSDKNVFEIVSFYRKLLDGEKINDSKLKKNYVLGWSYRGLY